MKRFYLDLNIILNGIGVVTWKNEVKYKNRMGIIFVFIKMEDIVYFCRFFYDVDIEYKLNLKFEKVRVMVSIRE